MCHLLRAEALFVATVAYCLERPHREVHESREGLPVRERDLGRMVPVEQRCTVHAGKERETVRDVGADVRLGGTLREELLDTGMGRAQLIAQREEELVELLVRVAVRVDDDRWDPGIADLELVE